MPLQTSLSPAARRDEASTFLLLLINATSQLTGYTTWLERAGDPGSPVRRALLLCKQQQGRLEVAGCRRGSRGRQILL